MTVEKAAMAALDDSDGEYEELEDDFLMIANEGQVAIEEVEEDADEADSKAIGAKGILKGAPEPFDYDEADFRSRDIQILEDEEDEEEKALREYREAMAALLPDAGNNFTTVF